MCVTGRKVQHKVLAEDQEAYRRLFLDPSPSQQRSTKRNRNGSSSHNGNGSVLYSMSITHTSRVITHETRTKKYHDLGDFYII